MELTMIDSTISLAKNKLARHKQMGNKSGLSIMEVAQLMDLVTFGPTVQQVQKTATILNFQLN